jgi:hypothetical protein
MELTNVEMKAIEHVIEDSKMATDARELQALQSVLIGGGLGDVQF